MKKRIMALFAALLMLSGVLCACANNTGENGQTTTQGLANTVEDTTSITASNILGPRDFNDDTITFYSRSYNGIWSSDLLAESNGGVLEEAIFTRNVSIEQQYNVRIEQRESGKQAFNTELEANHDSNKTSHTYDVVIMGLSDAATAASKGLLYDLRSEVPNVNIDGEWWSQAHNSDWSVGGKQFYATGDITTIDDMAIRMMYFNKSRRAQLELESPYDLVKNNGWTFDKFFEMVDSAYADEPGTDSDKYGVTAQLTFGFMMLCAADVMITTKNNEDIPEFTIADSQVADDVISYLSTKISSNPSVHLLKDPANYQLFMNGNALFLAEVLAHAKTMRGSGVDFGLLPMPKFSAEQEEYCQYTTGYCTLVVGFPSSVSEDRLQAASFITEALAVESVLTVTPAFYRICLQGQYSSDEESSEMIEIITKYVSSDLAEVYAWNGFKKDLENCISNGESYTSLFAIGKQDVPKSITETVNKLIGKKG